MISAKKNWSKITENLFLTYGIDRCQVIRLFLDVAVSYVVEVQLSKIRY